MDAKATELFGANKKKGLLGWLPPGACVAAGCWPDPCVPLHVHLLTWHELACLCSCAPPCADATLVLNNVHEAPPAVLPLLEREVKVAHPNDDEGGNSRWAPLWSSLPPFSLFAVGW